MIVEDDAVSQMSLGYLLRKLGHRDYEVVENLAEAGAAVQMRAFSAVFLNPSVPAGDETEVTDAASLLVSDSSRPVIYLGDTNSVNGSKTHLGRHVGTLRQPYRMEVIEETLERAQSLHRDLRSLPAEDCNRMMEHVFDAIEVGVCVISQEGRFLRVNRAYSKVFGYREEDLLGKPFTTILPRHLHVYAEELHERFIRGEQTKSTLDWQVVCADGDIRESVVKSVRFEARDGQVFKITAITDVTDSRGREKELERAVRESESALRGVCMRSRASMHAVSDLLDKEAARFAGDSAAATAMRESMCRARALSLLHDVYFQEGGAAVVSVNNYIRLLWESVCAIFKTETRQLQVDFELADVEMDMEHATHLGLFVNEALTNAARHAFPGSDFGRVSLRLAGDTKRVHIAVADNGVGLPDEFSVEGAATPGFSLLREAAATLGGEVYVEGVSGTRLSLTFPRASAR
ncbi:MAG: PAS domain S-box protein [Opitutales bacterium]|nr:PAS domain S-box protein [Opitutales bacterium]